MYSVNQKLTFAYIVSAKLEHGIWRYLPKFNVLLDPGHLLLWT